MSASEARLLSRGEAERALRGNTQTEGAEAAEAAAPAAPVAKVKDLATILEEKRIKAAAEAERVAAGQLTKKVLTTTPAPPKRRRWLAERGHKHARYDSRPPGAIDVLTEVVWCAQERERLEAEAKLETRTAVMSKGGQTLEYSYAIHIPETAKARFEEKRRKLEEQAKAQREAEEAAAKEKEAVKVAAGEEEAVPAEGEAAIEPEPAGEAAVVEAAVETGAKGE